MVLPLLGGVPAVWTTSILFFQAMLLLGYAYAHFAIGRLGPRGRAATVAMEEPSGEARQSATAQAAVSATSTRYSAAHSRA